MLNVVETAVPCDLCEGTGERHCQECGGTGTARRYSPDGRSGWSLHCYICETRGALTCAKCDGIGFIRGMGFDA